MDFRIVDQYLANVLAQVVTDCTDDDITFLVDQEGSLLLRRRFGDGGPEVIQVVQIPLQFLRGAVDTGGTDDNAHVVRDIDLVKRFTQLVTLFTFDAA